MRDGQAEAPAVAAAFLAVAVPSDFGVVVPPLSELVDAADAELESEPPLDAVVDSLPPFEPVDTVLLDLSPRESVR